jgi:hypothetical protein
MLSILSIRSQSLIPGFLANQIHLLFQAGEGRLHPHQMQRTERSKFSEVGITFDTHMGAIGKGASPHRRIVSWGNFVKAIHLN